MATVTMKKIPETLRFWPPYQLAHVLGKAVIFSLIQKVHAMTRRLVSIGASQSAQ